MTPTTIYRIENQENMHGMWYNDNGEYDPIIDRLCPNARARDFPMGWCEDHIKDGKCWYSAGNDANMMNFWFNSEDAQILLDNGFKLYKFVVNEYQQKENEVLFTREGVISMTVVDPHHIWPALAA